MQNLAWVVDREKFRVAIEGHTRAGIQFADPGQNAWKLSLDRADAARRALTYYAVAAGQIDRVTGFADTHPLPGLAPDSESNQRITLSLSVATRPRHAGAPAAKADAADAKKAGSPQLKLFADPPNDP